MQAERDHLVRFVFQKLREQLLKRRIHFVDVDLRWGVRSDQDASSVCREVIDECRPRFLCILGGRYGWVPPGQDRSITADEVHYGVLDRDLGSRGFTYFYFRDPTATAAMLEQRPGEFCEPAGSEYDKKLRALKAAIGERGLKTFVYPATWDPQHRRLTGLTEFGQRVYGDLLASIDAEFGHEPGTKFDEFAEENAAVDAFVEQRTQQFVLGGRAAVVDELIQHANGSGGNGYLCLIGESGSGKSALLAYVSQHTALASNSTLLIRHFVGVSPGSTDLRRTQRRLCHELKHGAALDVEIPEDPQALREAFPEILRHASAKRRVVLLIDAINQFDWEFPDLCWLPDELPANVRIIISTLAGSVLDAVRAHRVPPKEIELSALSAADAGTIIDQFCQRYRKSTTEAQRSALCAKPDGNTPLYLLAALEELRTLGTYEEITERIRELPGTTQALFAWILQRLEADPGFRNTEGRLIGRELVSRFASLLSVSRHGLSHRELAELLAPAEPASASHLYAAIKVIEPEHSSVEPDRLGNVAALLQLLRPYLMRRGPLVDFYHGQFRAAAEQQYLRTDGQRHATHVALAQYFRQEADPDGTRQWKGNEPRPFLELPFHLQQGDAAQLDRLVWDPRWHQAKLDCTDVYELIRDLGSFPADRELRLVRDAVYLSANVLAHDPRQYPSQLVGRLAGFEEPHLRSLTSEIAGITKSRWLRPLAPSLVPPGGPLLRSLEGHSDSVRAVAVTTDGKVVSGSDDHTLKVWDLALGKCLRTLEGHTRSVCAVAVTADGRVVSGSDDKTLKVWNLNSGRLLRTLASHSGSVRAVAVTADGKSVLGSEENTIRVLDLTSGRLLRTFAGHSDGVRAVAVTADGKAVSASRDKTLQVRDIASGKFIRIFEGHAGEVTSVAVTIDGKVVSGSEDRTLKVWDLASGNLLYTFEHTDIVNDVAVTADGKAISVSRDHLLKVWDLASGKLLRTLKGHTNPVSSVAVTSDNTVVSGSFDRTLKVWDFGSPNPLGTGEGHSEAIKSVAVTADFTAVSCSRDNTLKVWDGNSGRFLRTLEGRVGDVGYVRAKTRRKTIFEAKENTPVLQSIAAGRLLCTIDNRFEFVDAAAVTAEGVAIFGTITNHYSLNVWNIASGKLIRTLKDHIGMITSVVITPDGIAVIGTYDHALAVWAIATGKLLRVLKGHTGPVHAVAVTADGMAVSGSEDRTIKVWELASGRLLRTLEGHTRTVDALAVTVDGKVVSGSWDHTVRVWDLASGQLLASYTCDSATEACAIAPDGRTIVAGDTLGRVHFLRLEGLGAVDCEKGKHLRDPLVSAPRLGAEVLPRYVPTPRAIWMQTARSFFSSVWASWRE